MLEYVSDLFSLELALSDLRLLVDRWLEPVRRRDGTVVVPWSLGFHVLRKA
jgi:hypothetical protein